MFFIFFFLNVLSASAHPLEPTSPPPTPTHILMPLLLLALLLPLLPLTFPLPLFPLTILLPLIVIFTPEALLLIDNPGESKVTDFNCQSFTV